MLLFVLERCLLNKVLDIIREVILSFFHGGFAKFDHASVSEMYPFFKHRCQQGASLTALCRSSTGLIE